MIVLAILLFILFPAPSLFLFAFAPFGEWMLHAIIAVVGIYIIVCEADRCIRDRRLAGAR